MKRTKNIDSQKRKNFPLHKRTEEALKESEEQLKNVFDKVDIVFFSADIMNHKLLQISPNCKRVYGIPPQAFFHNPMLWREVVHPDDTTVIDAYGKDLLAGKVISSEYRIVLPNEDTRWVETKIKPTLDDSGALVRIDGCTTDISMRKQVEEMLKDYSQTLEKRVKERTQELERADKKKAEFLADASHELRTPLAIMRANVDVTLREESRGKTDPYETLRIIRDEIDLISKIMSDLTTLARGNAGDMQQIQVEEVNLTQLLCKIVHNAESLAKKKEISLELNAPEDITLWGDASGLEKLFMNLFSNAIFYGKARGWIHISLKKEDTMITVTVEDNGIGIPKEDLSRIFERFYRIDKARSRQQGGTGLGLAIAKWIAQAHNGDITASSTYHRGSAFTVRLPKRKTH